MANLASRFYNSAAAVPRKNGLRRLESLEHDIDSLKAFGEEVVTSLCDNGGVSPVGCRKDGSLTTSRNPFSTPTVGRAYG